jgi:hypothetical protein
VADYAILELDTTGPVFDPGLGVRTPDGIFFPLQADEIYTLESYSVTQTGITLPSSIESDGLTVVTAREQPMTLHIQARDVVDNVSVVDIELLPPTSEEPRYLPFPCPNCGLVRLRWIGGAPFTPGMPFASLPAAHALPGVMRSHCDNCGFQISQQVDDRRPRS